MKVWICFWTYAPLHQGHLDVIMKAKMENDICLIFVCGKDDDRWCACWLPLSKRYHLVKEFFKNDEKIMVICLDETSLWLDNSWSDENWIIWLSNAYNKLKENQIFWEIRRYVWEKFYKKILDTAIKNLWEISWIVNNSVVLIDRSENLISWTECRENPLKNWNKIARTFRGNFSHNILVLWGVSEQKTMLVNDIAKYFWLVYGEENWMLSKEENLKFNWDLTCRDFEDCLNRQYLLNRSKIDSEVNTWIFISDVDSITTLIHAKMCIMRKDKNSDSKRISLLTKSEYETILDPLAKTLHKWIERNKIFFIRFNNNYGDEIINEKVWFEFLKDFELMDKVEFLQAWSYYENFCTVKNYIRWLLSS